MTRGRMCTYLSTEVEGWMRCKVNKSGDKAGELTYVHKKAGGILLLGNSIGNEGVAKGVRELDACHKHKWFIKFVLFNHIYVQTARSKRPL